MNCSSSHVTNQYCSLFIIHNNKISEDIISDIIISSGVTSYRTREEQFIATINIPPQTTATYTHTHIYSTVTSKPCLLHGQHFKNYNVHSLNLCAIVLLYLKLHWLHGSDRTDNGNKSKGVANVEQSRRGHLSGYALVLLFCS